MRERPILFSSPMVRAILDGRKTQTRRAIKPQPADDIAPWAAPNPNVQAWSSSLAHAHGQSTAHICPYGQHGDRLWVKETIRKTGEADGWCSSEYVADGSPTSADAWPWERRTLSSIHCPRGLSRILLEVINVRVERLQGISEADAIAEGVHAVQCNDLGTEVPYYLSLIHI